MDVKLKEFGCVEQAGCLFSFGLMKLFVKSLEKKIPVQLTEQEMIFGDGKTIRWQDVTKAKVTRVLWGKRKVYLETIFDLKHANGKIKFGTRRVANEPEVVQFIKGHLPAEAVE